MKRFLWGVIVVGFITPVFGMQKSNEQKKDKIIIDAKECRKKLLAFLQKESELYNFIIEEDARVNPIVDLFYLALNIDSIEEGEKFQDFLDLADKIEGCTNSITLHENFFWLNEVRYLSQKHIKQNSLLGLGEIVQGECREVMLTLGFDAKKRKDETILIQKAFCNSSKFRHIIAVLLKRNNIKNLSVEKEKK